MNVMILPLLFISDIFIPLEDAPAWLTTVADIFPVKHFSSAMHTAFNPFETGAGFEWINLLVLAAWLGRRARGLDPILLLGASPVADRRG